MPRSVINWEDIPESLLSERTVKVCLKCGFDLMTKQLGLARRTAYTEMRKFAPASADFRRQLERPLFTGSPRKVRCPYCDAAKRWIATIRLLGIDEHREARKNIRPLLTALKTKPEEYITLKENRSAVDVFSDWLERTSLGLDFEGEMWLRDAAIAYLQRREPMADWSDAENINHIFLSRRLDEGWERVGNRLYLSPALYGDVLVVQYLIGRTHLHGALTFEGRLTPFEFFHRLRRLGYLEKRGIAANDPGSLLEAAIEALAAVGEIKPRYVIDRTDYLKQLKTLYDGMKK
jgi:hypothetical protein